MPEVTQITFSHKELAEILVRHQNLHEGIWGLHIEFGLTAANIGVVPDIVPAAIVPILKIGLTRFGEVNAVSVDAAQVNSEKRVASRQKAKK
jgi:hypothetical protein